MIQHKFKKLALIITSFGIDPRKFIYSIIEIPAYIFDLFKFISDKKFKNTFKLKIMPILSDKRSSSGIASGHYFHQDLWAARKIYKINPLNHIDVGSRIDGFVAHILTFTEVLILDVRNLSSKIQGLSFQQVDLMDIECLPEIKSDSLSCLHTLEHFGLGRYGDPLNIDGWKLGLNNLSKFINLNGTLLLSVPIGIERIEFNAHRVFNPITIINQARSSNLILKDFSFIDDNGNFHDNISYFDIKDCYYGCGCFHFIKVEE
jgi:hypothetical protein